LLSLGWRDRELQVATGFGFYSLVSLAVATVNTHQATASELSRLYWAVAISFLCSFFYWIFSFAQAETERRGFTPQMQTMLLALAATARVTCASLANGAVVEPHESESRFVG
jgi:apolipoprotein N-acyltransferase